LQRGRDAICERKMRILALIAAGEVSGPSRGLFQLIELSKDTDAQFVVGMFLVPSCATTPSIEEGKRRGFQIEILTQRARYDPGLLGQAWRVLRKHHVEVLQSHGYKPALLAWCLKSLAGIPWVAFVHGYTSENRRIALYNRLDSWLLRRADRVVVVSESTGRLVEKAGVSRKNIRVIPTAIDPDGRSVETSGADFRSRCGSGPHELLIGVIGRLSPEKGQKVFLEAFSRVVQAMPIARAVVVGAGQEMAVLKQLVRTQGLEDRVTFTGHETDTAPIYAALDLVVIPSFSEGLPNVLLEAMAHQKPVVATKVGGIPEVLQHALSKFLVPSGDAKAMADAIIEVLRDPALRRELGEAGARRARDFSPSRRTNQIIELYKESLNRR
jgi:glycosyltransferase involved in cell wall biosynthesis